MKRMSPNLFPYISRIHTAYIGEYLHFRYLKCLVRIGFHQSPQENALIDERWMKLRSATRRGLMAQGGVGIVIPRN